MRRSEGSFPQGINLRSVIAKLDDPDRRLFSTRPFSGEAFVIKINRRDTYPMSEEVIEYNKTLRRMGRGEYSKDDKDKSCQNYAGIELYDMTDPD